ncbi:hypothetical protein [Quadrisphaera setariae]|uniref:Uncharacterized protein n=1 Tax=Quadrisphaera setariae TaxID=2593304 RepID=A0A5C8Z5L8_9ACTN|nr:hypothetical protein [Quadrisphaera setariae]TXR52917.1 hypothetical protein FMM08_17640 [Quadrisphaera setariae]
MSSAPQHSQTADPTPTVPAAVSQQRRGSQGAGRRPVWAVGGGAGVMTGGLLLTVATVLEAGLGDGAPDSAVATFSAFYLAAAVVHAAAMLPLALGSTGSNGICGRRVLGTVALLSFGAVFLMSQVTYWVLSYGGGGSGPESAWILTAAGLTQLVLLLTASTVVVVARVAAGAARWAFPGLTAAAVVAGIVVTTASDPAVITGALLFSTCSQVVAGAVLLAGRARTATPRPV